MNLKTKLFFDDENSERLKEEDYLAEIISHANPDSEFGKNFSELIGASQETIFTYFGMLKNHCYNVIVGYTSDEMIVGHLAYQEHLENGSSDFRAFSYFVLENHRSQGYTYDLTDAFLSHARKKRISKIRIGKGTNPIIVKNLQRLQKREDELQIKVTVDGWINLRP